MKRTCQPTSRDSQPTIDSSTISDFVNTTQESSSQSQAGLLSLPDEILTRIVQQCITISQPEIPDETRQATIEPFPRNQCTRNLISQKIRAIFSLAKTSSRLRNAVGSCLRSLHLKGSSSRLHLEYPFEQAFRLVSLAGPYLQSLTITAVDFESNPDALDNIHLHRCINLQSLRFISCHNVEHHLHRLLDHQHGFPELRSLAVERSRCMPPTVEAANSLLRVITHRYHRLNVLALHFLRFSSLDAFTALMSVLGPNLSRLRLGGPPTQNDASGPQICDVVLQSCTVLTVLELSIWHTRPHVDAIKRLCRNFARQITSLSIFRCDIHDRDLRQICFKCENLENLAIHRCNHVTANGFIKAIRREDKDGFTCRPLRLRKLVFGVMGEIHDCHLDQLASPVPLRVNPSTSLPSTSVIAQSPASTMDFNCVTPPSLPFGKSSPTFSASILSSIRFLSIICSDIVSIGHNGVRNVLLASGSGLQQLHISAENLPIDETMLATIISNGGPHLRHVDLSGIWGTGTQAQFPSHIGTLRQQLRTLRLRFRIDLDLHAAWRDARALRVVAERIHGSSALTRTHVAPLCADAQRASGFLPDFEPSLSLVVTRL